MIGCDNYEAARAAARRDGRARMLAILTCAAVTTAVGRLVDLNGRIAPVAAAPAAPRGLFGEQPRWASKQDAAYVPADVGSVLEAIGRVTSYNFVSDPALDAATTGLSGRLRSAVHHVAAFKGGIVPWRNDQGSAWDDIVELLWPVSKQIFDAVVPEHLRWPVVRPESDGVPRRPMRTTTRWCTRALLLSTSPTASSPSI